MCISVHSDGHLTVKVFYEQIWPRVVDGDLEFLECYDLILRSHSPNEIKKLLPLSPHVPTTGDTFELRDDAFDEFGLAQSRVTVGGI